MSFSENSSQGLPGMESRGSKPCTMSDKEEGGPKTVGKRCSPGGRGGRFLTTTLFCLAARQDARVGLLEVKEDRQHPAGEE